MILADTSVWIDHFRKTERRLVDLLESGSVRMHPAVLGELALGSLGDRQAVLDDLGTLATGVVASPDEVRHLIETRGLHGRGIGYVDAWLLASVVLSNDQFWVRDKRTREAAVELGIDASMS